MPSWTGWIRQQGRYRPCLESWDQESAYARLAAYDDHGRPIDGRLLLPWGETPEAEAVAVSDETPEAPDNFEGIVST